MQEDIKIKIKADTREAKKNIKNLGKEDIKINAKIKKPNKDFLNEIKKEVDTLGKKVADVKLKKENFSTEKIVELRKEIELTALKSKAIYFSDGNKSAKELSERLKAMHEALATTGEEAKKTTQVFSKMDLIVGNVVSSLLINGVSAVKNLVSEGARFNRELEYADKKIQSISGKNSVEIQSNIGRLSLETGTDPIELRNGLYEIISSVGDVDEAYNLLETSNKLAITGFTDISNAVDGLTTVLNAYQMQLSEADRVANIFVKTQKFGKITVDEFARDLAHSIPYATQLGVSIEEIGSSIALLTSRGVKPAQAETQLSSFLRNVLDDNNELAKALKRSLGTTVKEYISQGGSLIKVIEEISNIEQRFGKAVTSYSMDSEGKAFILTMKDNVEAYKKFYKEISNTDDEMAVNMANMMNSQKSAMDRAKTYWQELSRTAGETTGKILAYLGDMMTGYDNQSSAMTVLNANLRENLRVVENLGNKNNKTAEEQATLNKALEDLVITAPDIANAYKEFAKTGKGYADVLELIRQKQDEVNESNKYIKYTQNQKEIERREKSNERLKKRLDNYFHGHYGSGAVRNIPIEEAKRNGMLSELRNKNPQKALRITEEYKDYLSEQEAIRKLKEENNELLHPNKLKGVIKAGQGIGAVKPFEIKEKPVIPKTDDEIKEEKKESDKIYKAEQLKIETTYNEAILKATKEYNKEIAKLKGKGTQEEIEAIKTTYEREKAKAEYQKNYDTLTNKIKNSYYETDDEKDLNVRHLKSEQNLLYANNKMQMSDFEREKTEKERTEAEKELKTAITNMSANLKNLSSLFQTIGENTGNTAVKNLANIGSLGSTIFDTVKSSKQGEALLTKIFGENSGKMESLEKFSMGAGIGGAISGALGGGAEGNIGGTLGSAIGTAFGGSIGSVVGGTLGSAVGSIFGRKSRRKKRREERRRKQAQERLRNGMISGKFKWSDIVEQYGEELKRAGAGKYINLFDKVSQNTDYDTNLSKLNSMRIGSDGVSMSALKQLMPQYNEEQIKAWFKSVTGGAVLNGDILSTGEGKYGAIDMSALAQQLTTVNKEMEKSLKETIKNVIDFSAESIAQVVKEGFGNGIDGMGDSIEKMIANSMKNAFLNTEISKGLFNGLSDKVADYVKEMFKNDKNLGINLESGNLDDLTFNQYIELIKQYMEMSNEKMEDLFKELGLNIDNLTDSMDTLNKNMSKNMVSGLATNLWKQNLGIKEPYKINQNIHLEIPVTLDGKEMDRYIIKTVNGSLQRSRRSGNGIGRG